MKPKVQPKKVAKKRTYHKKIVKVVGKVKEPVLLVPEHYPEILEPIVLFPAHIKLDDDPNWITRAWRWMIE